jgi:hypothetical protein
VRAAVLADPELTERQKQVLLEIYESFRKELSASVTTGGDADLLEITDSDGEAGHPESLAPDEAGLARNADAVPSD